jgi:hypothetical protein
VDYKKQYSAAIEQMYLPDDDLIDKVETCRTRNIYKKKWQHNTPKDDEQDKNFRFKTVLKN